MKEYMSCLKNGVVLTELGGYGDGPYCSKHGKGSALVLLGTYIVDKGDAVPYPSQFVFKPGKANYASYLKEHVVEAKKSGAKVGVSVVSIELEDTVEFLSAAQEAGADYISLCAHSNMPMFIQTDTSAALCYRKNWPELQKWVSTIITEINIPFIIKLGINDTPDMFGAVDVIRSSGCELFHFNFVKELENEHRYTDITALKGKCPFIIISGGIKDNQKALKILNSGADTVAVGAAAMEDPDFCGNLQKLLSS